MNLNPFSQKENLNITSLNEGRNMLFFCIQLVAPFYLVTALAFVVDILGLGTEFTLLTLGMGMAAWGSLTAVHWSNLKSALAELKQFSSIVRFDQTTAYQLSLLFDEDRIEYVGSLERDVDGQKKEQDIYKVHFLENYGYIHPTEGLITFNKAYIVLPFPGITWKETFTFKNKMQVWFKGLALTCGNTEFTVFDVSPMWDWIEGEWIPTFKVADSWQRGVRSMANMMKLNQGEIQVPVEIDGEMTTQTIKIEEDDTKNPFRMNEIIKTTMLAARKEITKIHLSKAQVVASRDNLLDDRRNLAEEVAKIHDANEAVDKTFFADSLKPKWKYMNMKYAFYGAITIAIVLVLLYVLGA